MTQKELLKVILTQRVVILRLSVVSLLAGQGIALSWINRYCDGKVINSQLIECKENIYRIILVSPLFFLFEVLLLFLLVSLLIKHNPKLNSKVIVNKLSFNLWLFSLFIFEPFFNTNNTFIYILTILFFVIFIFQFRSEGTLFLIKNDLKLKMFILYFCIFLFFIIRLNSHEFPFTGDEPHYSEIGVSFLKNGNVNDQFINQDYLLNSSVTYNVEHSNIKSYKIGRSPMIGILASPFLVFKRVNGARFFVLIISIIGFIMFVKFSYNRYPTRYVLPTLLLMMFSIPMFTMSYILYTGAFGATIILISYLYLKKEKNHKNCIIFLFWISTLPFIHVRFALMPVAFYALYIYEWIFVEKKHIKNILIYSTIPLGMFWCFYIYSNIVSGGIFNLASAPSENSLIGYFISFIVQLFGFRHGLLTYNPIWIFIPIILLIGLFKRDRESIVLSFLIIMFIIPMIRAAPMESPTARVWTGVIPLFAFALLRFSQLKANKNWIYVAFAVLLPFTIYHSYTSVTNPGLYLMSREFSFVYSWVFDQFKYLDFASILPGKINSPPNNIVISLSLFYVSSIFIVLLTLSAFMIRLKIISLKSYPVRFDYLFGFTSIIALLIWFNSNVIVSHIEPKSVNWYQFHSLDDESLIDIAKANNYTQPQDVLITVKFKENSLFRVIRFKLDCPYNCRKHGFTEYSNMKLLGKTNSDDAFSGIMDSHRSNYFLLQNPKPVIEVLILLRSLSNDDPIHPFKMFFLL